MSQMNTVFKDWQDIVMRGIKNLSAGSSAWSRPQRLNALRAAIEPLEHRLFLSGTVQEYTTLATYTAATTELHQIDFATAVAANQVLTSYSTSAGLTLSGVNFVGPYTAGTGYHLYATAPAYDPFYQGWDGNPDVLQGPAGVGGYPGVDPGQMLITLPSGSTEVGFNIYDVLSTATTVNVTTASGTQSFSIPATGFPALSFFGATSATPITGIAVISGASDVANLSSFSFGPQSGGITVPDDGKKLAFKSQPTTGLTGTTLSPLTVAVETAKNAVVTADTSTETIAIASGPAGATLGGTLTATVVHGIATFSDLSVNTAGHYKLKVTDGTLTAAVSKNIVVTALPTTLVFVKQPTTAQTGSKVAPPIVVDIEDAFGNLVKTAKASVSLSVASGPPGEVFPAALTAKAVGGVATFRNLVLADAGTYTLLAAADTLTSAVSGSITVSPILATKLLFVSQPKTVLAGATLPPIEVEAKSAKNILATSDTSAVTLSIAKGPKGATLGGTLTAFVTNGIATFSDLSLTLAGSYTFKATDGTLTAAVSKGIVVSAAAAAELVIVKQPTTAIAGKKLSPIVVDIEDAFGNLEKTAASVSLALTTAPESGIVIGTATVKAPRGIATFANLKLSAAGVYNFDAIDGLLTSADSSSIIAS